jgi:hypothetical protein
MASYFPVLEEQLGFPAPLKDTYQMPVYERAGLPDTYTFDVTSDWMLEKGLIEETYTYDDLTALDFIK